MDHAIKKCVSTAPFKEVNYFKPSLKFSNEKNAGF